MKKLFVAIAMIIGLGTSAMAQVQAPAKAPAQTAQKAANQAPQFTEINVADVPAIVADAFKAAYPQAQILKAATATIKGVLVYKFTYQAADKPKAAYFSVSINEVK